MRRFLLPLCLALVPALAGAQASRPNIVFILADDLGYGEIGRYGQKLIATPNVDRLAAEGMTFMQFYAGNTVCAPSRSVLMTGLHMGHTRVRGNAGRGRDVAQMLQANDVTIAKVLHDAGYATGLAGKWGLGLENDAGEPRKQGFDYYFGFLNQTHAHNHFPSFLWRNGEKVELPNDLVAVGPAPEGARGAKGGGTAKGGDSAKGEESAKAGDAGDGASPRAAPIPGVGYATKRVTYANDLFFEEANAFIERNRARPFFFYLALTTPHGNNERSRALGEGNEVPDQGPYVDRPWNDSQKNHAAMVTRMDAGIGAIMAKLKQLGLDEKTLVIFSSDNGPHREGGPNYNPDFFTASGPLRGIKRDLFEGGIREPFIARWPGHIAANSESKHVGYFGDLMATWAELAGAKPPPNLDSISVVPTLLGRGTQAKHDYLYWEFYEAGFSQAVLIGDRWKGVKLKTPDAPIQVFDLHADIGEKTDLAEQQPEIVARVREIMRTAHVDNEHWKLPVAKP